MGTFLGGNFSCARGHLSKVALRHLRHQSIFGGMIRVLFICGKARMRSPTAADMVSGWPEVEADFAGLSNDADERLSLEQIEWADIIAVMEQRQKKRLLALFGQHLGPRKVSVLAVPDRYDYGDPALIKRLAPVLQRLLRR
jgi:predicted protein tyrosine phosphatase